MNREILNNLRYDVYERENYTYANVAIFNPDDSTQIIYADLDINLVTSIVKDPRAYTAAVTSFSLPISAVPLFKFLDNTYRLTISYLGVDYSAYMQFVPYSNGQYTRNIFYVQQFLDSMNNTFTALYNLLITAHPGVVNAAPYVVYNNVTSEMSFIFDGLNYNYNLANPVKVYFNDKLFSYFLSLQTHFNTLNNPNFKDVQIMIKDNGVGSTTGSLNGTIYTITTEYDVIPEWSFVKSIVILSSTTGIKSHLLFTNAIVNGQTGNNLYQPIIASLDVNIGQSNRNGFINYDPKVFVYNDITGDNPLTHLSFRFAILTRDLQVLPISLYAGQSANIVIQFKHKTILS